jgi:hypothetical protein
MEKDFWFEDLETGEEFFVEVESLGDALAIANEYFERPMLLDIVSPEVAEMMGLDTY